MRIGVDFFIDSLSDAFSNGRSALSRGETKLAVSVSSENDDDVVAIAAGRRDLRGCEVARARGPEGHLRESGLIRRWRQRRRPAAAANIQPVTYFRARDRCIQGVREKENTTDDNSNDRMSEVLAFVRVKISLRKKNIKTGFREVLFAYISSVLAHIHVCKGDSIVKTGL